MERSGRLAYGKEYQINVFKIQSVIRHTSTFGFTACGLTGVTLENNSVLLVIILSLSLDIDEVSL
jgi:hypothetical protein